MRGAIAVLLVGSILFTFCGGSGDSELSRALDECLHNCVPGDEGCRDHCISVCVDGCLGNCPYFDCKPLLSAMREEHPNGWVQDCIDYTPCMVECRCYGFDECLAAGEMVFGPDAPCPDSLYERCKDVCYAF